MSALRIHFSIVFCGKSVIDCKVNLQLGVVFGSICNSIDDLQEKNGEQE